MKHSEQEFLGWYEEYADALFRYCYFKLRSYEAAKDMVQHVFTKTWEYVVQGKEIQTPKAFLYRTALNAIINISKKKTTDSLEMLQEGGLDPGEDLRKNLFDGIVLIKDSQNTQLMYLLMCRRV